MVGETWLRMCVIAEAVLGQIAMPSFSVTVCIFSHNDMPRALSSVHCNQTSGMEQLTEER